MANVTTKAELKIFVAKSFTKDGETVDYNVAYFLTSDSAGNDDVIVVNTKKDLSGDLDKIGDLSLSINNGKLSLVSFTV